MALMVIEKNREDDATSEVSQALQLQESFYKEKSRNQWLQLGDRCTNFFHLEASIKASKKNISLMWIEDEL